MFSPDDIVEKCVKLDGGYHNSSEDDKAIWNIDAWHMHDPVSPFKGAPDSTVCLMSVEFKPGICPENIQMSSFERKL